MSLVCPTVNRLNFIDKRCEFCLLTISTSLLFAKVITGTRLVPTEAIPVKFFLSYSPSLYTVLITVFSCHCFFFFFLMDKETCIDHKNTVAQKYTGSIQKGQSPEKDQKQEERTPKPETITYTPSRLKNPKYFCLSPH